jgi:predicted nucleotidyltransferase
MVEHKIGIDVGTASLQLKQLEQQKIIKTVTRGRNVDCFLNLANMIARYYLVLAEIFASINFLEEANNYLVKKATAQLRDHVNGILILFGSHAKKQALETSDVDFYVIADRSIDKDIVQSVEDVIGLEINIEHSNLRQFQEGLIAKEPLMHQVLSDHIILKEADAFCDLIWEYYAKI